MRDDRHDKSLTVPDNVNEVFSVITIHLRMNIIFKFVISTYTVFLVRGRNYDRKRSREEGLQPVTIYVKHIGKSVKVTVNTVRPHTFKYENVNTSTLNIIRCRTKKSEFYELIYIETCVYT